MFELGGPGLTWEASKNQSRNGGGREWSGGPVLTGMAAEVGPEQWGGGKPPLELGLVAALIHRIRLGCIGIFRLNSARPASAAIPAKTGPPDHSRPPLFFD